MTGFVTIWRCGCGQLERTADLVADRCPGHDSAPVFPWMPEPSWPTATALWGHTCGNQPYDDGPCSSAESDDLFDGAYPDPEPSPDPYAGLSKDARRTAKQRDMIAAGQHPATRLPLANNGRTCGDCAHFVIKDCGLLGIGSGRYFKCAKQLHGPAGSMVGTDVRKSWPACTAWAEPASEKDTP